MSKNGKLAPGGTGSEPLKTVGFPSLDTASLKADRPALQAAEVRFTVYISKDRLSKLYKREPVVGLETVSGTQFASGGYYVCEIPTADMTGPAILALTGQVIDKLTSKQAIGLGVPKNGTITGTIVTKARHAKGNITALTRTLEHFGWPELGLLLLDGDDIEGLPKIVSELYPPFADVAVLVRPSASASVVNPKTGKQYKSGEHVYAIVDDPSLSDASLKSLLRLAWCCGKGPAGGRLMLSKRGDTLVRGPIDASVGSCERLCYEGEIGVADGIVRLARVSKVAGGTGMLCAKDLIAFADLHAPADQYEAKVAAAKSDPKFIARKTAAQAAYRGEHVAKAVQRGIPREKAEKAYDEAIAAGSATIGERTWLPLTDEHALFTPDGKPFTIADIKRDPLKYHDTECADPIEGLEYQSKNCAIIYTNGPQIEIYSRAHGDAYAYAAPFDNEDWSTLFARITGVQTYESVTSPAFSEDAMALIFAKRHGSEVRYTEQWGKWHLWDGLRWAEDRKRKAFNMARTICREVALGFKGDKKKIANNKTKLGVLGLVKDDQRLAAVAEQWDTNIWKLCTPGGMVDLKTGELGPALPDDYCTMMTAAAPGGPCPLWLSFLNTVTAGDQELIRFLQVCCGYALTGSTREQILLFLWGRGNNGKTVFIETVSGLMGDYHTGAPMDTFTETKIGQERHPTELAGLRGARLVTAAETEQGRHWAESKIKSMTGTDAITARFMRQDFFDYIPQFTLMVYGNHKPGLKSVDEAIRRRMKLIPFTVTIPKEKRDKDLKTKLEAEWGGILAWMIEGCVIWQREGLLTPKCVEQATAEYLNEEDTIARWIDECCVRDPQALTPHGELFESWKRWAEGARAFIGSGKKFTAELKARDFVSKETKQGTSFIGLRVANPFADLVEAKFMDLLRAEKVPVSANEHNQNYAPKVFAAKGVAAEWALAVAMQCLLKSGKIKAEGTSAVLTVARAH